jgi:glycosyltransferase involved in cell wall biosynthesis
MAKAWAEKGHGIILCAGDGSEGQPLVASDIDLPATASVHLYHAYGKPGFAFGHGAIPALLRTCLKADIVYISGVATWPTSLAGLLTRMLRRPYVLAVHGGMMAGHVDFIRRHKPFKWLFYRLITLPTLRRARLVHVTAELEAAGVRLLAPEMPLAIVPNAVDLAAWSLLPPRPPGSGRVLAYVGRLSPEKGILPFLESWMKVRRPDDRLLIAGSGQGPYAAAVAALAARADGAVEMPGYLTAAGVRDLLARADMLVLPSGLGQGGLRENFGIAVIEAMASGRSVLVSRGMAWDDAAHRGYGLVFDPTSAGTEAGIAAAAALKPDQLAAMGQAARREVENRYGSDQVAAQLWNAIDRAVNAAP